MTGPPAPPAPPAPIGILLAAGRSERMGRPKQLLPWPPPDGPPLVCAAFDAIARACAEMVVVVGSSPHAVVAALGDRRFHQVRPQGAEMIDSVRAGLRAVRGIDPHADALLHPADHPEVARSTLTVLLEARRTHGDLALLPEHAGRGGHPAFIPVRLFDTILEWAGPGGLRRFWREHPECCQRLPVDDPWVVRDVDTPDAYSAGAADPSIES